MANCARPVSQCVADTVSVICGSSVQMEKPSFENQVGVVRASTPRAEMLAPILQSSCVQNSV